MGRWEARKQGAVGGSMLQGSSEHRSVVLKMEQWDSAFRVLISRASDLQSVGYKHIWIRDTCRSSHW
eukprot:9721776-Alexandrium_andersonii.AAC.1